MAKILIRFVIFVINCVIILSIHLAPPAVRIAAIGASEKGKILLRRKEYPVIRNENILEYCGDEVECSEYVHDYFTRLLDISASAATSGAIAVTDQLTYLQTMTAGALSRTMAQTLMHPANTYKTILQLKGSEDKGGILMKLTPERLLRGVDAQFIMSIPHGACYFFVIDRVKNHLSSVLDEKYSFVQDFLASTISTVFCSIVSTPQMVITDRLMAGVYPSFPVAVRSILSSEGFPGFYAGWWPALAQKIPSYG